MARLRFDWDATKAASNLRKHGVSFHEAQTAFYDESARLIDDPDHSVSEDRFVLLGLSFALRILGRAPHAPGWWRPHTTDFGA